MARAALEPLRTELFDAGFQLALADAWREWDESTPDEAEIELDPAALLECADPDVRALARVFMAVDDLMERLCPAPVARSASRGRSTSP